MREPAGAPDAAFQKVSKAKLAFLEAAAPEMGYHCVQKDAFPRASDSRTGRDVGFEISMAADFGHALGNTPSKASASRRPFCRTMNMSCLRGEPPSGCDSAVRTIAFRQSGMYRSVPALK
jgi:hypothetical protein